jgi:hypothetical protein
MSIAPKDLSRSLFPLGDLDDRDSTRELAHGDLDALRSVAAWVETFVARPHPDLGRAGPVCPFVPGALQRNTLWLAAERIADRSMSDIGELIRDYQRQFEDVAPTDGDDVMYKAFIVVFTDLSADRASEFFGNVLDRLSVPSYVNGGFVMGGFHEGNQGTAVYNATFQPFTSPVPFLLVRQAVVSDWKFFLDDDDWLDRWADRHPRAGVRELAEELRRLPWRAGGA